MECEYRTIVLRGSYCRRPDVSNDDSKWRKGGLFGGEPRTRGPYNAEGEPAMSILADLRTYARFARGLRGFLHRTM